MPRRSFIVILLIFLDVFSHWFQMYASLASGATTHKVSPARTPHFHPGSNTHTRAWLHARRLKSLQPDWLRACSCSQSSAHPAPPRKIAFFPLSFARCAL